MTDAGRTTETTDNDISVVVRRPSSVIHPHDCMMKSQVDITRACRTIAYKNTGKACYSVCSFDAG